MPILIIALLFTGLALPPVCAAAQESAGEPVPVAGAPVADQHDDSDTLSADDRDLADRARTLVEGHVADDTFSGAVLLARGEQVLLRGAWGLRDRDAEDPNTLDTRFNLGSITKTFTAVTLGQLVEAGELDWHTTVGEVLPDYPRRDVHEQVTVAMLATHSSGIPDYWSRWDRAGRPATDGLHEYVDLFVKRRLDFKPGTESSYSNSGVVVLGLMIEALTGEDYYEVVRRRVFEPAGMERTAWLPIREPVHDQAIGYEKPDRRGHRGNGADENPGRGCPAGGSYSTVDDMHRFALALQDGTLVSPAMFELLTTKKLDLHPGVGYGYLFFDLGTGDGRHVGHDGGSAGVNAEFYLFPATGHVLIVLANYEQAADLVAGELTRLLLE